MIICTTVYDIIESDYFVFVALSKLFGYFWFDFQVYFNENYMSEWVI